ncbi:MAG: CRISPR-associated endonuclease Cas2 [Nitrososphaerota archaeon]
MVTYDCREERTRRRVRSLLRKYSFTMLTYSVYVGRGSRALADRIASQLSKLLDKMDRATVILLNDFQYEILMEVTKGVVSIRGERMRVIVFYGMRKTRTSNENIRRSSSVQNEGEVESRGSNADRANSS